MQCVSWGGRHISPDTLTCDNVRLSLFFFFFFLTRNLRRAGSSLVCYVMAIHDLRLIEVFDLDSQDNKKNPLNYKNSRLKHHILYIRHFFFSCPPPHFETRVSSFSLTMGLAFLLYFTCQKCNPLCAYEDPTTQSVSYSVGS